jgi:hypothetical protein
MIINVALERKLVENALEVFCAWGVMLQKDTWVMTLAHGLT